MEWFNNLLKNFDSFLNRRRITIIAFLVIGVFLGIYIWVISGGAGILDRFGCVIGGDFIEFYTAGRIIDSGKVKDLYNVSLQRRIEADIVYPQKTDRFYQYVTPPFFAFLFVPLSKLSYLTAFSLWTIFSIILLVCSLLVIGKHGPAWADKDWFLTGLVCFAYIPFSVECLAGGQNSAVTLFILAAVYHLLKKQKDWTAGIVLALGLYKPQLILIFVLFLIISNRWKTIAGFCVTAGFLTVFSVLMIGPEHIPLYQEALRDHTTYGIAPGWKIWKMHSYSAFFRMLFKGHVFGADVLTILAVLFSVFFLIKGWLKKCADRQAGFDLKFALTVTATLLISPYTFGYELTLLLLPVLLVLTVFFKEGLLNSQKIKFKIILAMLYIASLTSDQLAKSVNVQITVPIMVIWGGYIYQLLERIKQDEQSQSNSSYAGL